MTSGTTHDSIRMRNEGGVVVAEIVNGTFREEKKVLAGLERLGEFIGSRSAVRIALDMSNVEYVSSAGLGRLVALLKKSLDTGGGLHVACLRPEILELFDVMRLREIFNVFDSVDDAIGAFREPA